jgi:alpha/beta superfamily hydrolase
LGLIWLLAAVGLTWLLWLGRQQLAYVDGKFDGKHPTRSIPAAVWWVAVGWSLVINGILSAMVDLKLSRRSEQGLAVAGRSDSGLVAARRGVPAGVSVKPMRHQIEFGKRPPWGPSAGGLELVQYDAPLGKMWAYVTQPPFGAGKRPAILWITGGDCNSLGDVSDRHDPDNDQSAAVYRTLDFVTMYPSLRGGHDNPGERELFYGEVDDVLAAAEYLARLPYVDPKQIYLGGHSTGGTLVLLAAACSDRFRAVFSFGPTDDVRRYDDLMPEILKLSNKQAWLRSPIEWLEDISSPTFVMEGAENGNVRALQAMQARSTNPQIQFLLVPMHDHFSILGHGNQIIAGKIFGDNGAKCNLKLSVDELRRRDGNAPLRIAGFEPKHISPIEQPQFRSLLDEPRRRLPIPFDDPGGVPPGLRRRQQGASVKPPPNLQKPADMSDDEWVDRLLSELEGLKPTDHQSIEDHVEALSATGSERAIRPIVKRVADVYPKAEQALVPFGPKAESVILDELETAKDNEYVRRLADALGAVGTDRSLPILERLSKHPYTWAKVAASFSTTKIERRQRVLQYQDR